MNKKTPEISALRQNYNLNELIEEYVFQDPVKQFEKWFKEALEGDIYEPNAMILSTLKDNHPRSRVVLLKGFGPQGFEFYTNYESDKGKEIDKNDSVSLLFYWDRLQRQVRIEGRVEKLPETVSDEYFSSRPRGSQIGAWVSNQSEVISNKAVLEKKLSDYTDKFGDADPVPRPDHWGGFRVIAAKIEFWQGRPNRLHDRLSYEREIDNNWQISRLSP